MNWIDRLKAWAQDPNHKILRGVAGFAIFGTALFFTDSLWIAFAIWITWKCVIS